MTGDRIITRRSAIAASATGLLVSGQHVDAAAQPLMDITIRVLNGLGQPLNQCVLDFSELQTGQIRRARQTGSGEYQVPCGRGPQLLTVKRSADRTPELTIQQLWGPDAQRIALQLPGQESTGGRVQQAVNQVNALQELFFLGLLYPEFRAATFNADTLEEFARYASESIDELQAVEKAVLEDKTTLANPDAVAGYLSSYRAPDLFRLLDSLK